MKQNIAEHFPRISVIKQMKLIQIKLKVMGIGGVGCNAMDYYLDNCRFGTHNIIAVDSDKNVVEKSMVPYKIFIGDDSIEELLTNTDIIIIYSAFGGVTGSNSTPEIIKIAKELGVYCICIVSTPFNNECNQEKLVKESIKRIKVHADTSIIINSNESIEKKLIDDVIGTLADKILFEKVDTANKIIEYRKSNVNFVALINTLVKKDEIFNNENIEVISK